MDGHDKPLQVRVEAYAGQRADESPRAFTLGERRVAIIEELDRWLDPRRRYFKVRGDDGHVYILRHDVLEDSWELSAWRFMLSLG